MMKTTVIFEKGQVYTSDFTGINIFILSAYGASVTFIEGFSPSAIHDKQEIPYKNLVDYMTKYEYELVE